MSELEREAIKAIGRIDGILEVAKSNTVNVDSATMLAAVLGQLEAIKESLEVADA